MPDRLLIVEDNPSITAAIERAGERLELHIDVASDGWDAIELLRDGSYRAIVIDTDLPRHSGYGVLSYLREEKGDHLRNVILMTSADRDAGTSGRQRVSGSGISCECRYNLSSNVPPANGGLPLSRW